MILIKNKSALKNQKKLNKTEKHFEISFLGGFFVYFWVVFVGRVFNINPEGKRW